MNQSHSSLFACLIAVGLTSLAPQARSESFSLNFTKIEHDLPSTSEPVVARYDHATRTLWVDGTDDDDVIRVSVDAEGTIVVNDGAVMVTGGNATLGNTHFVSVDGGAGNDVLIDATGLGAELLGGWGMDVLLWDDLDELDVQHGFATADDARDFDLMIVNTPTEALSFDDKSITGTTDNAVAYFDGRLLTQRDFTSEQTTVRRGRVLALRFLDASGNEATLDGEPGGAEASTTTAASSAAGKVVGSDELGSTALTLEAGNDGRRIVRVTSWE